MPRRCGPGARQVVEAVPMYARHAVAQKLRHAPDPEVLHLFRTEAGRTDFRYPDRQVGDGLDLSQLVGPFVDRPVVPIERETVHRDKLREIEAVTDRSEEHTSELQSLMRQSYAVF